MKSSKNFLTHTMQVFSFFIFIFSGLFASYDFAPSEDFFPVEDDAYRLASGGGTSRDFPYVDISKKSRGFYFCARRFIPQTLKNSVDGFYLSSSEMEGDASGDVEDVIFIAEALHQRLLKNAKRSICDVFEELYKDFLSNKIVFKNKKRIAADIKRLVDSVTNPKPKQKFLRKNIAYKALVLLVKMWPKKDLHCHVSPSLSAKWVNDVVKKNWDVYRDEFSKRLNDVDWYAWRKKHEKTVTLEAVRAFDLGADQKSIEKIFSTYEDPTTAFDLPINCATYNNLEIFLDAAGYVVKKYFDDGVSLVELRFNPCKEYNGVKLDPLETLDRLDAVVTKKELEARRKYGRDFDVHFVLSFNQANYPKKMGWFVDTIRSIFIRKVTKPKSSVRRVVGFDLSGMECEQTKRSSWKEFHEALDDAKSWGIDHELVVHLGDGWNVDEHFNMNLMAHLDYVSDALSIKNLSRIGHANILSPFYKVARPNVENARRVFKPLNDEEKKYIKKLVKKVKKKNIIVSCLPKNEFETIIFMKNHPIYYFLKRKIPVAVGIDGTCYTDGLLSDWVSWLLLASPRKNTRMQARLTVEKMWEIISWKR